MSSHVIERRRTGRMSGSSAWPSLIRRAEQMPGDDHPHDLVGAFEDLVHAQIAQIALDRKVLQIAVAAEQLQRLVADVEPGISRETLGHRAMHDRLWITAVEARGPAPDHQPCRVELGR